MDGSEGVFTLVECQGLLEHFIATLFRHFKLYKFCCTAPAELALALAYTGADYIIFYYFIRIIFIIIIIIILIIIILIDACRQTTRHPRRPSC